MGPGRASVGVAAVFTCLWLAPGVAWAQSSRLSVDLVAAADADAGSSVRRDATAWFDSFMAVRLFDGLDVRARPVVYRRAFDGEWRMQFYELSVRYERRGPVGVRVDGGVFSSPLGLAILENRPNNALVISQHSTLYLPVPRYEPGTPSTNLLAASYPLGAQVTVSGQKWDARAALTDSSPIRMRPLMGDNRPPRMPNVVVGGGVTPHIGLRVGGAYARGNFARQDEVRDASKGDRLATVAQVETEYSFDYTRLAGEYAWTRREAATPDVAQVHGGWVEATQTLTPRWFVSARYDDQRTLWTSQPDGRARTEIYRRVEAAVGYRVTPDITLRTSYLTRKGYVVAFWDDQFLFSAVFARRFR